jgi:hypothetical protein
VDPTTLQIKLSCRTLTLLVSGQRFMRANCLAAHGWTYEIMHSHIVHLSAVLLCCFYRVIS